MKKKIRWHNPGNGTCEYADIGEYRYFITQKYTGGWWFLVRRKKNPNYGVKTKCETFRELYTKLTGHDPPPAIRGGEETESDIEYRLRLMTQNTCGENTKSYHTDDDRYIAVDFPTKAFWEYPNHDEEIDPQFQYIPDLKAWAQQHLAEDDGQMTLQDLKF